MNTKQKIILKLEGEEKIYQKAGKKHQDSFWYDGDIAYFRYGNRELLVIATGDIRIYNKKNELVYDGKERGDGFPFELREDKDLKKIGNNHGDDFYWENNNWFEILYKTKDRNSWNDSVGSIYSRYDEAIDSAKELLFDDNYWG